MYDRLHLSQEGTKPEFYEGVEEFIMACVRQSSLHVKGQLGVLVVNVNVRDFQTQSSLDITCTRMCLSLITRFGLNMGKPYHQRINLVSVMLEQFDWGVHVGNEEGDNVTQEDNLSHYQGMIFTLLAMSLECILNLRKRFPNPDDQRFHSLLEAVNRPLQEGVCIHNCL